jgi:hypothetical protein
MIHPEMQSEIEIYAADYSSYHKREKSEIFKAADNNAITFNDIYFIGLYYGV